MFSKIIWLIFNILMISLSAIYDNGIIVFLSILSMAFLYDKFLDNIRDFKDKRLTLKLLFKEYKKFQTLTPTTLGIFLKVVFGTYLTVKSIFKFHFVSAYQTLGYSFILLIGLLILISVIKDVVQFNN